MASSLGQMPTTSVRRLIFAIETFERIDGVDFRPMIFRATHEGQHIGLCFVHERGELWHFGTQLSD
jgi:hypothetical protein